MKAKSKYEVHCPTCRVSFPPEQKRCIHCGGRTSSRMVDVPDAPPTFKEGAHPVEEPEAAAGDLHEFAGESLFEQSDDSEEAGSGRSASILRMLGTLIWVILAIGIGLVRSCEDG